MPTESKIKTKYKAQHDSLSENYYTGTSGLTKEEFDFQHGKIWNDMEAELIAEGYRQPPEPPLVFEPPSGTGIPGKVEYIEQFLKELHGG